MFPNRILWTIENWEELTEEARGEVDRLHFVYEVAKHNHDHDELDPDHSHEGLDDEGRLIGGNVEMARLVDDNSLNLDQDSISSVNSKQKEQVKLGFNKQPQAGDGGLKAELQRLFNYLNSANDNKNSETNENFCKKFEYVGTDKKYFVDFSYPICFDDEVWMNEDTEQGSEVVYDSEESDQVDESKINSQFGCLVYSFGNDNNWNFEETMASEYECGVFAFDPNLYDLEDGEKSPGVNFKKIGLGDVNSDSVLQRGKRDYLFKDKLGEEGLEAARKKPMRTFWGIMQELEHTNRIIDIVKIDREGPRLAYETTALKNLLEDGTYRCIKQLTFELHFFGPVKFPDHIRTTYSVLKGLENVGFELWRVQGSKSKSKLETIDDFVTLDKEKNTFMYTVSFINPKPSLCN